MRQQFTKLRGVLAGAALAAALLGPACTPARAAEPAAFRTMQVSVRPSVQSVGFRQFFSPNALITGGSCSATCCGGGVCASASAQIPGGIFYPGPCSDIQAICTAYANIPAICTCGCTISCSATGGPTGNLAGNGITTGAGGLANDFGTTRLAGPDLGEPVFTSHATTANQQWMSEALRRFSSIEALRPGPVPQSTADYEARYLARMEPPPYKPERAACPDDTSVVCLADSTRRAPDMGRVDEKELAGPGYPRLPPAPQDIGGVEAPAVPEGGDNRNELNDKVKEFYADEVKGSLISEVKDAIKEHMPGASGLVDRVESTIEGANIYKSYVTKLLPTVFDSIDASLHGNMERYKENEAKLNSGSEELDRDSRDFALAQSGVYAPVDEAGGQAKEAATSGFWGLFGH